MSKDITILVLLFILLRWILSVIHLMATANNLGLQLSSNNKPTSTANSSKSALMNPTARTTRLGVKPIDTPGYSLELMAYHSTRI
jgi:hypothetical protein